MKVGDGVTIRAFSHLTGAEIGPRSIIGPFARLRPGTVLAEDVHIGNFVEVKASVLGAGVKANHLAYIGDAAIGAKTNVGAGVITCNYDGFVKFRTEIGEGELSARRQFGASRPGEGRQRRLYRNWLRHHREC